jgi:addiction module RelE/StbE family toxin
MILSFSKKFIKQSKNLPPGLRQKLQQRLDLFRRHPFHPTLHNHALQGKYKPYRSIDIAGDLRALYLEYDDRIIFNLLGTHAQLYG